MTANEPRGQPDTSVSEPRGHAALLTTLRGQLADDDRSGGRPLRYRQLARGIAAALHDGLLSVGERLPAERVLARELRLSRGTVASAYQVLRNEGIVVGRRGSGTRIAASALATDSVRGAATPFDNDALISFAMATLPATSGVRAATAAIGGADLDTVLASNGYMPFGLPTLRETIAAYYTSH